MDSYSVGDDDQLEIVNLADTESQRELNENVSVSASNKRQLEDSPSKEASATANLFQNLKKRLKDLGAASSSSKEFAHLDFKEPSVVAAGSGRQANNSNQSEHGSGTAGFPTGARSEASDGRNVKSKYETEPTGVFSISTVLSNGKRLYFPYDKYNRRLEKIKRSYNDPSGDGVGGGSDEGNNVGFLLDKSVYRLKEEIEADNISFASVQTRRILDDASTANNQEQSGTPVKEELWLEKYRPQSFFELMSDERINENVMLWVKQWDQLVFGSEPKESLKKRFLYSNDVLGRPQRKILLIHGPPGLGKTTLASVVGRTAGYDTLELNASDERTGKVLREKVLAAIESKSVFGDKKPTMVILDEMDGLGPGGESFVNLLIKIATSLDGQGTSNNPNDGTGSSSKHTSSLKKKKKQAKTLRRPIICLCNDPYVPALRQLRQVAQVYHLKEIAPRVMINRLKNICDKEGLDIDMKSLNLLVTMAEGDWRVCLNTLQLLHAWKRMEKSYVGQTKRVSPEEIKKAVSIKDKSRSLFTVWEKLFVTNASSLETKQVLEVIEHNGDYDRVLRGAFEMYLNASIRNQKRWGYNYEKLHEFLYYADVMDKDRFQIFMQYAPYFVMAFHEYTKHVGSSKSFNISYPKQSMEARMKGKAMMGLTKGFIDGLPAITRTWIPNEKFFCANVLSYFIRILNPQLRPVNPQVMKEQERARFDRVVEVMATLKLGYKQEKFESRYTYVLEPHIDTLVPQFDENKKQNLLTNDYGVKQIVAFEVEQKKIQLHQYKTFGNNLTKDQQAATVEAKLKQIDMKPRVHTELKIKKKKAVTKVPRDFFGRPIIKNNENRSGKSTLTAKERNETQKVLYKYFEGYSNGVKRNLSIRDIMAGKSSQNNS